VLLYAYCRISVNNRKVWL